MFDTNSLTCLTANLSVLNSCRRAPGVGYQHGDRKGCLRGTWETVLNEIEPWTKDFNNAPVFWLNGLAGTGKSTIGQTVSEWTAGSVFLLFTDRSDLHFIFPSLAFQLAHKYLGFQSTLVPLQSNPDIVHESLYSQMGKLIVESLRSAIPSHPRQMVPPTFPLPFPLPPTRPMIPSVKSCPTPIPQLSFPQITPRAPASPHT